MPGPSAEERITPSQRYFLAPSLIHRGQISACSRTHQPPQQSTRSLRLPRAQVKRQRLQHRGVLLLGTGQLFVGGQQFAKLNKGTARSLFSAAESMATPCSVKA
jgi:hypothetical protein